MHLGTALAVMTVVASVATPPQKTAKVPPVLQGTVKSVEGNIIVLDAMGMPTPNGRQVDLSSATFEGPDGKPVARFTIRPNDQVLVVIDPKAPTESRPKARPGRPMPMFIRLLPLKAIVVERIVPPERP